MRRVDKIPFGNQNFDYQPNKDQINIGCQKFWCGKFGHEPNIPWESGRIWRVSDRPTPGRRSRDLGEAGRSYWKLEGRRRLVGGDQLRTAMAAVYRGLENAPSAVRGRGGAAGGRRTAGAGRWRQ